MTSLKSPLIAFVGLASVCVSFQACGASEPATPPQSPTSASVPAAREAPAAPADACGVHIYGSSYDATCQQALDQTCCTEEKTCAADADCKSFTACANACPHGKGKETESCIGACAPKGEKTPGFALFDNVATCSKKMPPSTAGKCDGP